MTPTDLPIAAAQVLDAERAPHLFVLSGHPGCGKTHALAGIFHAIAQHPLAHGYWPSDVKPAELMRDLNAATNRVSSNDPPPFLWWGVRVRDRRGRNASEGSAFEAQADTIDALLANHQRQVRMKERLRQAGQATLEGVAAIAQLSALSNTIQLLRGGGALKRIRSAGESAAEASVGGSLLGRIASGVASVCLANPQRRLPFLLAIDDLHHLADDADSREFLQALWERAVADDWPLTILATSDDAEYDPLALEATQVTRVGLMGPSRETMRALIAEELPGLTTAQQAMLLDRTFGSPGSLHDLVAQLRLLPRLFIDRNTRNPLAPGADERIAAIETGAERRWLARLAAGGIAERVGVRIGLADQGGFISGAALTAARRHSERHAEAGRLREAVAVVAENTEAECHG